MPGTPSSVQMACARRRWSRAQQHAGDQDAGPVAASERIRGAVRGDAAPGVPGPRGDPRRAAPPQGPGRVRPALQPSSSTPGLAAAIPTAAAQPSHRYHRPGSSADKSWTASGGSGFSPSNNRHHGSIGRFACSHTPQTIYDRDSHNNELANSRSGVRELHIQSNTTLGAKRYVKAASCANGFPVFSYRGGRCGPAVTGAVQPMLPAAGLPIRLRPGLSRRRSSACAAARPGAPAGHRTRRSRLRRRSRAPSAAAGRRPYRTPKTIRIEGPRTSRAFGNRRRAADVSVRAAVAGTCMPRSRIRSFCCSMFCCASARVGASVPRPHATSPKPAALAHAARARCRRPAAQCPAPTAAWVTTGATGTPIRVSPRA